MDDRLEAMEAEEYYLVGQIQMLQEAYAKAAKPYIERLARLRSLRPIPPMFITVEQARDLGLTIQDAPIPVIPASNKEQA